MGDHGRLYMAHPSTSTTEMDGPGLVTIEVPVRGMDCAECTRRVQDALAALPGVTEVRVSLAMEKAAVTHRRGSLPWGTIRKAVAEAGYSVPELPTGEDAAAAERVFGGRVLRLFGLLIGAVLFIAVVGEWLGLFRSITAVIPRPAGLVLVVIGGYPVFVKVLRAAWRRQVISHTLMAIGVVAALAIGEWATAAVVVFFMRIGDYVERFTTERARGAVKDLTLLAPQRARVERDGVEILVPVDQVFPGETVMIRPGDLIPVDGDVLSGRATVNQSTITGESRPAEVGPGSKVFAATVSHLGSLRIRTTAVGRDTTFGRIVRMVEQAEANRSRVQTLADRFSGYYLPIVAGLGLLTLWLRRDPMAMAAVLVVACSCSIALATPIAMLASIGAGAKRGMLIKGGKYLEILAQADVLLIDKTGTLTMGKPSITDVLPQGEWSQAELLRLAASAEKYSEHPLAEAVRRLATSRGISLVDPEEFEADPGFGVSAIIDGVRVRVGSKRMLGAADPSPFGDEDEEEGKTLLFVEVDGRAAGMLAAEDRLRPEVHAALDLIRDLGIQRIEMLSGDREQAAAAVAGILGVAYRAEMLPEQKIQVVKDYQARGHRVVMVGDGVNDAPALAQADVGIAMAAAGTGVAMEAAHIALMREEWGLIPELFRIARRTMGVVRLNLAFTAAYNLIGLTLASLGYLPPILAAAAQSLPDLGILANASRLLRQK